MKWAIGQSDKNRAWLGSWGWGQTLFFLQRIVFVYIFFKGFIIPLSHKNVDKIDKKKVTLLFNIIFLFRCFCT